MSTSAVTALRESTHWRPCFLLALSAHVALLFFAGSSVRESAAVGMAPSAGGFVEVGLVAAAPAAVSEAPLAPEPENPPPPQEKVVEEPKVENEIAKPEKIVPKKVVEKPKVEKKPQAKRAPEPRVNREPAPAPPSVESSSAASTGASVPGPNNVSGPQGAPSGVVRGAPDYLTNPAPPYPTMSRRLREEGRVMVLVQLSAAGLPEQVSVKHSSGFERLDEAAVKAVRTWKFRPTKINGEPTADTVEVPIRFALR